LSAGGTFLLGASFAFVIAPCCTPLVAAIVAYTTAQGDPVYGSSLLALFALGHGLPVALLGAGAGLLAERIRRLALSQATAVVSACLMVIVGCLYACIA
jgi:cytochrome c-type biogenesis protein